MHRTDAPGATVDNKFTDGDPVGGVQSTMVDAAWLNDVQENIMAVLAAGGVSPTKGRAADLLDALKAAANGRVLKVRTITTTSVFAKTAGAKFAWIRLFSGGGAGGGAVSTATGNTAGGTGGSAGGMSEAYLPIESIDGQMITIGAGGIGSPGLPGGNGNASSIGSLIFVPGGNGGAVGTNASPPWTIGETGNSATPTGGNITNVPGASGSFSSSQSTGVVTSGRGGNSPVGTGGNSRGNSRGNGNAAVGFAAGGGGAVELSAGVGNLSGGPGAIGFCEIWEYA